MADMPRRHFVSYNWEVWRSAGHRWWDQRGRIALFEVVVLVALMVAFAWGGGYAAVGWSIGLSVLALVTLAIGWLLCLGVAESAKRDWRQVRDIDYARGTLTDEEVRQAQRDRKMLQRRTFELLGLLKPAVESGSIADPGPELGQRIWDAIFNIQQIAIQTDHARGEDYYDAIGELENALERTHQRLHGAEDDFHRALAIVVKLEHEDRSWVLQRRRFRSLPDDQRDADSDMRSASVQGRRAIPAAIAGVTRMLRWIVQKL